MDELELEERRSDRQEQRARLRADIEEGEREIEERRTSGGLERPSLLGWSREALRARQEAEQRDAETRDVVERAGADRERAMELLEQQERAAADHRTVGAERRMYEQCARIVTDWAHKLKGGTNEAARADQVASLAETLVTLMDHHAAAQRADYDIRLWQFADEVDDTFAMVVRDLRGEIQKLRREVKAVRSSKSRGDRR
jgi:hypothetical protein